MTKQQFEALVTRVSAHRMKFYEHSHFAVGGAPCSETNRVIIARCLEAWLFLIEDLMLRLDLSEKARTARMDNFVNSFVSCDLLETLSYLEAVYMILIKNHVSDYQTFKQLIEAQAPSPAVSQGLLSPVNTAVLSFLSETNGKEKAHLLASICQFLRFPRKLELQDIGLEDQALQAYEETEQKLASVLLDDCSDIIAGIRQIIQEWFKGFHIDNLLPKHGPGSVAEGPLTLAEKFSVLKADKILQILLSTPSLPYQYLEFYPDIPSTDLERCSRTIFVPKTASKLRTISMEPCSLQYIQQGVMEELYGFINRHRYLRYRFPLKDQAQNQILALLGSKYQWYGTIDLSQASDSVSWDLVRRVFDGTPQLYRWLLGTRSRMTLLPDGRKIALRKFAPMGSALCFPIECIIFGAVVEYASRRAVACQPSSSREDWCVYGDDIVCPSHLYEDVSNILTSLGFRVNDTKSYNSGPYRESCGKEYYMGYDITPLYYRTPFYRKRPSPSVFGSWCSSANNAFLHRLPTYRRYLLKQILSLSHTSGPYFTDNPMEGPALYSPNPTNFHVKARWNRDYQRYEGRFISVKSRRRDEELDDDRLRYFVELVKLRRRPIEWEPLDDESPSPDAMRGCIEFFSSIVRPLEARRRLDATLAVDWSYT